MNLATLSELTQFGRVCPLQAGTKKPMKGWRWQVHNTDAMEITDEWLNQYPNASWALVPVRAFVVDVDVKNDANGLESIAAAGDLDPTFTVRTPSGGTHHYYAPDTELPFMTKNGWLPGVDIRYGDDGYVVLPYSKTNGWQIRA